MKNKSKFLEIFKSCYLCLKYPFLYPRNRFTGRHWNSTKIHNYLYGINAQYYSRYNYDTNEIEKVLISNKVDGIWDKAYENVQDPDGYIHTVTKSIPYSIWFTIVSFIYDYILPIFHCIPTYTELDAMPDGWRKAFGIQMCNEIRKQLIKEHYLFKYRIMQIKEKYGTLRWYDVCSSNEIQKIIQKYEEISWNTCIVCGKPSTKISGGWICPYCDEHFPTHEVIYQTKSNGKWDAKNEEEF